VTAPVLPTRKAPASLVAGRGLSRFGVRKTNDLALLLAAGNIQIVSHRTIEIAWLPGSKRAWATFTAARKEAAKLWSDMVERHHRLRRLNWKWPSKSRWEKWAAKRYPNLHSQTIQQVLAEFLEAVQSAKALRKNGQAEARYPWRKPRYRDVTYTNQGARIRKGALFLPNGKAGTLSIPIPETIALPGRLMEVHLLYGRVLLVCEVPDEAQPANSTVGVDLGVNTIVAATDGETAIVVSGREVKATVQWRNKRLAELSAAQAAKTKRSRRHMRLQRRKYAMLDKARNRVRDLTHKATAKVAEAFPGAKVYVGEPFNDAARKVGRRQAQQVSSACNRKLISQLDYKTSGAIEVCEAYSSQTCPVCACRQTCRRIYKCKECGFVAPRDVVGALNIRTIGRRGELQTQADLKVPTIVWMHPSKYPGPKPGSSGGHPASSS